MKMVTYGGIKLKKKSNYIYILLISIVVGVCDYFLQNTLIFDSIVYRQIINDVSIMLLSGYIGIILASKVDIPLWLNRSSDSKDKKSNLFMWLLGILLIAINAFMFLSHSKDSSTLPSTFNTLAPHTAFILSIRAALTEEILFRLFSISTLIWIARKITKSAKVPVFFAVMLSSVLFALIHQSFLYPFIYGLLLGYIYLKTGLIPVFIIHFLADVIPFTVMSIR